MADDKFMLGQHEAQIDNLVIDMASVKEDVAWIKGHIAERTGERRVAFWLAGSAGGVVVTAIGFIARHFKL